MDYAFCVRGSNRSKNRIDGRNHLDLDSILIWEVKSDSSRKYLISLERNGYDNQEDRIMVSDGLKESFTILKYYRDGYSISCCSAIYMMTEEERERYNSALNSGDYDQCIDDLFSLEISLNKLYGYKVKEKIKQKKGKTKSHI